MLYDFILRNVYVVKARRDTAKTTGNAHIKNSRIFLTQCNNYYCFSVIVRGRFRVGVGVDVNKKNNLIGRKFNLLLAFVFAASLLATRLCAELGSLCWAVEWIK